jgi:hypothetical protein
MIPVFLDSARKHKNLARTYKNWLPDGQGSIKELSEDLWAMLGDAILPQQQEPIDLTVETHNYSNLVMVP